MRDPAISFLAAEFPAAAEAGESLRRRYGQRPPEEADVIVALGGDGFMIETLHRFMRRAVPIYGINRGTVGFLMNRYPDGALPDDLPARIEAAVSSTLHPLRMTATAEGGRTAEALAINEVSLLRETRLAAHLRVSVDGRVRLDRLMCDGAIVSTPAGSTAYNLSAHGPILPLRSRLLALTPICAFRPRRWHGALLPESAAVVLDVLDADRRPVSATADYTEVRGVTRVSIEQDGDMSLALLFDPEHNLEERIVAEQFQTLP